jgi:choline transport protein
MFTASAVTANLANIVTAMIIFNKDDYVHHSWHTAMLMWLFILVPLVFNLYFKRLLNTFETIGGITHVVFFIVSIATLTALARHSTNEFVWQTLVNDISGWTNPGVAWGLGLLTMTVPLVGADGLLHMSMAPLTPTPLPIVKTNQNRRRGQEGSHPRSV